MSCFEVTVLVMVPWCMTSKEAAERAEALVQYALDLAPLARGEGARVTGTCEVRETDYAPGQLAKSFK